MRGSRQGAIVHGVHDMGQAVPLYDYSGIGMDLGQEVALYDYSGLGVDLGNPVSAVLDPALAYLDGLPSWAQTGIKVAGVLALFGLATGAVKAGALNPLKGLMKKKRTNRSRRRRRRNGVHASATRRNRSTSRRRRRRNPARRRRSRR